MDQAKLDQLTEDFIAKYKALKAKMEAKGLDWKELQQVVIAAQALEAYRSRQTEG